MWDNRLMILPCEYNTFPCGSFVCDQASQEKYFVGNPYSGGLHTYPVFCRTCIDYLVSHLPAELSPEAEAVESRIRAELEQQYNGAFQEQLAQAEARIRQEVTEKLVAEFTKQAAAIPVVVEAQDEADTIAVFRCLDCGAELKSAKEMEAHKSSHEETGIAVPSKRGRKKA